MSQVIAVIPARFASTRFPGKPLVKLGNKSMVQRVYERSIASQVVTRTIVATEDQRIIDEVKSFGGEAVLTRSDHLTGTDRIVEVTQKLIQNKEIHPEKDIIINIQGDEPGMQTHLIQGVVEIKKNHPEWVVTTAAVPMGFSEIHDPNRVKVILRESGEAVYFSRAPIPYPRNNPDTVLSSYPEYSQSLENPTKQNHIHAHMKNLKSLYYRHIGLYCFQAGFLLEFPQLPKSTWEELESLEQLRILQAGYRIGVFIGYRATLAVDTPEDVPLVEEELKELGIF